MQGIPEAASMRIQQSWNPTWQMSQFPFIEISHLRLVFEQIFLKVINMHIIGLKAVQKVLQLKVSLPFILKL